MKVSQILGNLREGIDFDKIETQIRDMGIEGDYSVYQDGSGAFTVSVDSEVTLASDNTSMKELPFKFGKVKGDFDTSSFMFTSLKNYPDTVVGALELDHMEHLTSLKGCPTKVGGYLSAQYCDLRDVENFPELGGNAYLEFNPRLTSLHNIHKTGKMRLDRTIRLDAKNIKSHVLGLLLLGCGAVVCPGDDPEWLVIINKYLKAHRNTKEDVLSCQDDLIDAGLDDYAAL
jgi:hypothetical protein